MTALWVSAGISVLGLLVVDVFFTVLHAQGRAGPLTHVQNRVLWSVFRRAGARSGGGQRPGLLAVAGPVMVVVTLVSWVVLLTVGYALVYRPWIESFLASPGAVRSPWVEALYYSGYTAATLGFGDLVPDQEALRLLAPVEAFSGFALMSASITYLLATYREMISMRSLALDVAGYFRANPIPSREFAESGGYVAMARWAESISTRLTHSLQAHFQYPILHFFRPADESWSLPVQLGRLLELRAETAAVEAEDPAAVARRHPSFRALFDAVDEYLREVERHFVPGGAGTDGAEVAGSAAEAHRRLLRHLGYR